MIEIEIQGTSQAVQWLRLRASTAGGMGLIPGQGANIPYVAWRSQKTKKIKKMLKKLKDDMEKVNKTIYKENTNINKEMKNL